MINILTQKHKNISLISKYNKENYGSNFSITTGLPLKSEKSQPMQVVYCLEDPNNFLSGIMNADILYEYINNEGKLTYNTIFYDNIPNKPHPITKVKSMSEKNLPKLSFTDSAENLYKKEKNATFIYATLSYNISSNFIFEDGKYTHYKEASTDYDKSALKPISVSNVVIQYINGGTYTNRIDSGKGILFTNGKVIEIEWNQDRNNSINLVDKYGNPVFLSTGKSWIVIVDQNCPVAYN